MQNRDAMAVAIKNLIENNQRIDFQYYGISIQIEADLIGENEVVSYILTAAEPVPKDYKGKKLKSLAGNIPAPQSEVSMKAEIEHFLKVVYEYFGIDKERE